MQIAWANMLSTQVAVSVNSLGAENLRERNKHLIAVALGKEMMNWHCNYLSEQHATVTVHHKPLGCPWKTCLNKLKKCWAKQLLNQQNLMYQGGIMSQHLHETQQVSEFPEVHVSPQKHQDACKRVHTYNLVQADPVVTLCTLPVK